MCTVPYAAPEVLYQMDQVKIATNFVKQVDTMADVYSFGVLMHQILTWMSDIFMMYVLQQKRFDTVKIFTCVRQRIFQHHFSVDW